MCYGFHSLCYVDVLELLVITRKGTLTTPISVTVGECSVKPGKQTRHLGVQFDESMTMVPQISAMCSTGHLHLRNIGSIRKYITVESEQPDAYKHLESGGFVVRRSSKQFKCVSTDQALEQTVNREAKSRGGVIGFTLRKGALLRWLQTRHVTATYSEALKGMCNTRSSTDETHAELGSSRLTRDASDVQTICDALNSDYQNPFDLDTVPTALINIITGQVASQDVEDSLTSLQETGKSAVINLAEKRLVEGSKSLSFWKPQPRLKTKTFADMTKVLPPDRRQKTLICSTEVLFRRLFSVSKTRDVNLKTVLQHELAAVPPALFGDDGSMRKNNKADLATHLESVCAEVHSLPTRSDQPDNTAYIIDGMAMMQALNEDVQKLLKQSSMSTRQW